MTKGFLLGAAVLAMAMNQAARAQGTLDCQTITNDIMVTDAHAYMPSSENEAAESGLGDRTSGQILARWATVQDRDPEACGTLKLVQQRLAAEAQFAAAQCPDVVSLLRERTAAANSEAAVVCGRK